MDGRELQKVAGDYALGLPGANLQDRTDPRWDRYKVQGKVFMLMTDLPGSPVVILKAAPDDGVALREQYAGITPGYHMNKEHWITLGDGGGLNDELVRSLVLDSYQLVVDGLPKSKRPTVASEIDRDI